MSSWGLPNAIRAAREAVRVALREAAARRRVRSSIAAESPRGVRGREQRGARYAVIVQADEFLGLSTVLASPTSTAARTASFRPVIALDGILTRVLVEQTTVVDPERLGSSAGRLDASELRAVDNALGPMSFDKLAAILLHLSLCRLLLQRIR